MAEIALAEAIKSLRAELKDAFEEGQEQDMRFRPGPIELELEVQIAAEGKGEAKSRFWIVDFSASGSLTRTGTHRIKMTLQAVDRNNNEFLVLDKVKGRPG